MIQFAHTQKDPSLLSSFQDFTYFVLIPDIYQGIFKLRIETHCLIILDANKVVMSLYAH